jgi:hypothetical protein
VIVGLKSIYLHFSRFHDKSAGWYIPTPLTKHNSKNTPPPGKPCGIEKAELFLDRKSFREEMYNTVWFTINFLKVLHLFSHGILNQTFE